MRAEKRREPFDCAQGRLGRPLIVPGSLEAGRLLRAEEGEPMTAGESDQPIVL